MRIVKDVIKEIYVMLLYLTSGTPKNKSDIRSIIIPSQNNLKYIIPNKTPKAVSQKGAKILDKNRSTENTTLSFIFLYYTKTD